MRFKASLKIDLPSQEILKRPGAIASFFGTPTRRTGKERVFGSTLQYLDCFVQAYHAMNIRNVVALKIDQQPIYLDNAMVDDDFNAMIGAINTYRNYLQDHFKIIHLVVEHEADGIHYVLDTKIRGEVSVGTEEVHIVISGKINAFNPVPNEKAHEYRERIRNLVAIPGYMDEQKTRFNSSLEHILNQLKHSLGTPQGYIEYSEAAISRPSKRSVTDVASRRFGQQQRVFRGDAIRPTAVGYCYDPYSYYYYNPFDTLADLIIIGAILDHTAVGLPLDMMVYNFDGQAFGDIARLPQYETYLGDVQNIASEQWVSGLESGDMTSNPDLGANIEHYGTDQECVTNSFDAGDAGYFDDTTAEAAQGSSCSSSSCSSGDVVESSCSSCSASSCSSCSSCASCSSCSSCC